MTVIMGTIMPKVKTFIAKHVLEVRFKEKNFKFLDFYGELIDALHSATDFEKVKVENAGARIEVASADYSKTYFFSLENFGFQIDAETDIESFKTHVSKLLAFVGNFQKFELKDILRIGTKSSFFCHIPSRPEEGLRQIFFNKLFANKSAFESTTGLEITDIAFTYFDAKSGDVKSNILTGPSNLEEAISRYFQKPKLYSGFNQKAGVFYDIDTYSEYLGKLTSAELNSKIATQIGVIEKSFTGYMDLFNEKTK